MNPLPLLLGGAIAAVAAVAASKKPPTSANVELDANMPPALEQQVLSALANETDPNKLMALSQSLRNQGYPLAANALATRAAQLNVAPRPAPVPALDPGMDPQMMAAVLQALASETDPNKLAQFGQSIAAQYPIASALLLSKARALGYAPPPPTPAPAPAPVIPTVVIPGPSPADAQISAAGTALLTYLQNNGCSQAALAPVSAFQSAYNADPLLPDGTLVVDGKYGQHTQDALQAAIDHLMGGGLTAPQNCFPVAVGPAPTPAAPPSSGVYQASVSSPVSIQHALNLLGVPSPPLVEDGDIGPLSTSAIKTFQFDNSLTVDGIAGPQTVAALNGALQAQAAMGTTSSGLPTRAGGFGPTSYRRIPKRLAARV